MSDPIAQEMAVLKQTLLAVTLVSDPCPEIESLVEMASKLADQIPYLTAKWEKLGSLSRAARATSVKRDLRDVVLNMGAKISDPDDLASWGISQCDTLLNIVAGNFGFLATTLYGDYLLNLNQIVGQIYDREYYSRMLSYSGEFTRSADMRVIGQFHSNRSIKHLVWLNEGSHQFNYDNVSEFIGLYGSYAGIYEKDLLFLSGLIEIGVGGRPTYEHLRRQHKDTADLVNHMKASRLSGLAKPWDEHLRNTDAHTGFHLVPGSAAVSVGDRDYAQEYTYEKVVSRCMEMVAVVLACRLLFCLVSKRNWVYFQSIAGEA